MKPETSAFDIDAAQHGGYLYTEGAPLSSQLANKRLSDIALSLFDFKSKQILDLGCGDGTYTKELFDRGGPTRILGIDPARRAIDIAQKKYNKGESISFAVGNAYQLEYAPDSFDLVHVRGVLHHMSNPALALKEAFRVAPAVLVIEPNGNNVGLKMIEKLSRYHREHKEKSYTSRKLKNWIGEAGGNVTIEKFAGFVPMFCPDWMARMMKRIEPAIERLPILSAAACAVYVLVGRRSA